MKSASSFKPAAALRAAARSISENIASGRWFDPAVVFALLHRLWQLAVAPVTVLLIASFFSPELQGFFFTFASLLALQVFVELGFNLVIVNVASHEWSQLHLTRSKRIDGDAAALSRLISLGRLVFKWYAAAGLFFILAVSVLGYVFFSQKPYAGVVWAGPWLALVAMTGGLLGTLPFIALLEGCNQVVSVNKFRLGQTVLSTLSLWVAIWFGLGLWAAVIMSGVKLGCELYLISVRYRAFFRPFFRVLSGPEISWRAEVWPMQWRIGLSGAVGFFVFSLFNPIMFHYHGAVIAGQMGLTWRLAGALQAIGNTWILTKIPRMGIHIAHREFTALDRLWVRSTLLSVLGVSAGAAGLWGMVYLFHLLELPLANRLLAPLPTALFLSACVLMQIAQCQGAYLRAHKREPLVGMSVVCALVSTVSIWILGSRWGAMGAAVSFMGVMILQVVWETRIWLRCRAQWHT